MLHHFSTRQSYSRIYIFTQHLLCEIRSWWFGSCIHCAVTLLFCTIIGRNLYLFHFFPSYQQCYLSGQEFFQGIARSWSVYLFILLDTQNCFLNQLYHFFFSCQQCKRILMLYIRGQQTFSVNSHVVSVLGFSTKW